MIVGVGYIGCAQYTVGGFNAWYTLGPGATISLPRIASHIGATTALTGRTEKSSTIASPLPLSWRSASFEFTFESGAGFEAPFANARSVAKQRRIFTTAFVFPISYLLPLHPWLHLDGDAVSRFLFKIAQLSLSLFHTGAFQGKDFFAIFLQL